VSLKGKVFDVLRLQNLNDQFEERINITTFFPTKALFLEIGFVLSKFIGFYICLNTFYTSNTLNIIFLLVIFSLSWSFGLVVPAAPGGVGVFEACLLLFVGKSIPQNITIISLVYFRVISTSADLFLSLPFLIRKLYKRILFFFSKLGINVNEAIRPRVMIIKAGNIASTILSSPAYWYILTDNVSKSNGLKIKVIGNSFMVSTKTKSDPTNIGPLRRGRWILLMIPGQFSPSPSAASSRLGDILSRLESIEP